jgi:hypothetical protein
MIDRTDECFEGMLMADGYDSAIIGVTSILGQSQDVLVYDSTKVIECLVEEGMPYDEAVEYFGFNIKCAYMGEGTPLFVTPIEEYI